MIIFGDKVKQKLLIMNKLMNVLKFVVNVLEAIQLFQNLKHKLSEISYKIIIIKLSLSIIFIRTETIGYIHLTDLKIMISK
jgi:hypothetical protein